VVRQGRRWSEHACGIVRHGAIRSKQGHGVGTGFHWCVKAKKRLQGRVDIGILRS